LLDLINSVNINHFLNSNIFVFFFCQNHSANHSTTIICRISLFFNWKRKKAAILILATDEPGETRINTEEFIKLTIQQKSKYPSVKVRESLCKSVAKKIGGGFRLFIAIGSGLWYHIA
jgi:uncharacterized protein (DUF608 family)